LTRRARECSCGERLSIGFKRALAGGQLQIGLWSTLASHIAAEVSAGSGFDWLLLDIEHAPNDVSTVHRQLQGHTRQRATSAVVRPAWERFPSCSSGSSTIGVQSMLVPFVQNAEEAARAVAATRYRAARHPRRGDDDGWANRYGRVTDYLDDARTMKSAVVVQIETRAALAAWRSIASVDGIDGLSSPERSGPRTWVISCQERAPGGPGGDRRLDRPACRKDRQDGRHPGVPSRRDARHWIECRLQIWFAVGKRHRHSRPAGQRRLAAEGSSAHAGHEL
jgi:4-hydroxy-2-oxoheptanedioate aldolase